MSIIKQIAEGTALLEVSKALVGRYLKKAADKIVDHSYDMGAAAQHGDEASVYDGARKKASKRLRGVKLATDKLQKEETEVLSEGNVNQAAEKLSFHGYKKFGDSDKVDHKSVLSHFHNEKTGHMICVDHHSLGRINSVSTLKCTNPRTGEMQKEWGTEHVHVEHALQELGHKSHIGFREEVEIEEGNAANKFKKNVHVAKLGAKALHVDGHDEADFRANLTSSARGTSKAHATKSLVGAMKKYGRQEINHPTPKETYHADYDRKKGVYHIKHTATDKIVDHDVANSGGAALAHAAKWNKKAVSEEAIEEGHRKGRPKKARHEDGKIVNDPDANDTKPAN